jgi:glucose 1-dehydrogenase
LVTGAAQGNGEAIARCLVEAGVHVILCDRVERGAAVAAELGLQGSCEFIRLDMADEAAVADIVEGVGALDGLVNNAGIIVKAPLEQLARADLERTIAVNVFGYLSAAQAFVRAAQVHGRGGSVVNVCSVSAHRGRAGFAAYAASKGAILSMTRSLAVEAAPLGITVNSISPGVIDTPMNADWLPDTEQAARALARIPIRRVGKPADVAAVAGFLLSREANWVTGVDIPVDGGWMASGSNTAAPMFAASVGQTARKGDDRRQGA